MALDSEIKEEIKEYFEELQKGSGQLTKKEKTLIREEIEENLNRDRELQPNEERLIKKAAKRYNIFISILATIGVLGT